MMIRHISNRQKYAEDGTVQWPEFETFFKHVTIATRF